MNQMELDVIYVEINEEMRRENAIHEKNKRELSDAYIKQRDGLLERYHEQMDKENERHDEERNRLLSKKVQIRAELMKTLKMKMVEEPVSVFETEDGRKMIRVKTLDEDFLLDPKCIDNGKGYEFDEAMERLKELGLTTFNKKQALVMSAYHYEINRAIEVLGGDKLNWEWSVSEYNDSYAWCYYGNYGAVNHNIKYSMALVRPVLDFPSNN